MLLKIVSDSPPRRPAANIPIAQVRGDDLRQRDDALAVEEPLEIRVAFDENGRPVERPLSVTMRTPGDDFELAAGFLFTEGIVRCREQLAGLRYADGGGNVVVAELSPGTSVDLERLQRHFYTTSSCGVCGKTSIAAVRAAGRHFIDPGSLEVDAAVVHALPGSLRAAQSVFDRTGGLHASALFDARGDRLGLREDVGRHNALDKLIGAELLAGRLPLRDRILLVSGRASFELVQKAMMAGIPILAAVGAPSSLAVSLAKESGMTLLGFVRDGRFNIYCGPHRIRLTPAETRPS